MQDNNMAQSPFLWHQIPCFTDLYTCMQYVPLVIQYKSIMCLYM